MSAEDNTYPRWITCPQHLVVQHKGKSHVYDWPYHTAREGVTRILVQNERQEQSVHLQAAATPRIQVKSGKA